MLVTRSRFRSLALATAIATVALFAIGGLVRGTGSGLGCSTWPACEPGRLFPSGTVHSLIEFSHRAMAFLVIVLTALTGLAAFRVARREPAVRWPAVLAFPLVLAQAGLGAVVVATELDPWWVTAHLVAALILIADVTYVAAAARTRRDLEPLGRPSLPPADHAHRSRRGAPPPGGDVRPGERCAARLHGLAADGRSAGPTLGGAATAMFLHRALAAIAMLVVLWTTIRARLARRHPLTVRLSTTALLLFVAQVMVGAANVWTRLRPWAVVAHVALSVLIWATVVALATVASRLANRSLSRRRMPARRRRSDRPSVTPSPPTTG